jgi:hypothetical protein
LPVEVQRRLARVSRVRSLGGHGGSVTDICYSVNGLDPPKNLAESSANSHRRLRPIRGRVERAGEVRSCGRPVPRSNVSPPFDIAARNMWACVEAPMAPYSYEKKACAGCGRTIAHTSWRTPRWHRCPHGQACVHTYGLLGASGGPGPGGRPKRHKDPRYRACAKCAAEHGWRPRSRNDPGSRRGPLRLPGLDQTV